MVLLQVMKQLILQGCDVQVLDGQSCMLVFARKHVTLPGLVEELRSLLSRQQEIQAYDPNLQASIRQAMYLEREIISGSNVRMWMREVFPSREASYRRMIADLQDQAWVAYINIGRNHACLVKRLS